MAQPLSQRLIPKMEEAANKPPKTAITGSLPSIPAATNINPMANFTHLMMGQCRNCRLIFVVDAIPMNLDKDRKMYSCTNSTADFAEKSSLRSRLAPQDSIALKMAAHNAKRELRSRADLDELILALYERLMVDPQIGKFFTQVVPLDLAHHIPKIASFWESLLFQTGDYQGDPMAVHIHLNRLSKLDREDFEVWLGHFDAAVDELFEGENAERAKQRARSIATLMQIKIQRDA